MSLHTIPHTTSTLTPAGFELNLNLTLYGDLYIREKREGETGRQKRHERRQTQAGKHKTGRKFHSYFIHQSNTERQAVR